MRIDRNQLLTVLSEALDHVEKEVLGVTDHHAKRVAWLCIQMGKAAGMSEEEISRLKENIKVADNVTSETIEDSNRENEEIVEISKLLKKIFRKKRK